MIKIKKYKLYAEIHELNYFVVCEYNGSKRIIRDKNDITEDELLFGSIIIMRDSVFHHYKLITDDIIKYGNYYKIGDDIKLSGIIYPIVRIENDIIYSSCISELDNSNDEFKYNIANNLLKMILYKRDKLFEEFVNECEDILEEPKGVYNYGKKIFNKIFIRIRQINKRKENKNC